MPNYTIRIIRIIKEEKFPEDIYINCTAKYNFGIINIIITIAKNTFIRV